MAVLTRKIIYYTAWDDIYFVKEYTNCCLLSLKPKLAVDMEDPIENSSSSRTLELSNMKGKKGAPQRSSFVASVPKALLQNTTAPIVKMK
ncbi:hypothetical protein SUGI_1088500 [Cryptomeria japonica]|nr:hypothetical protein SUGI_1088500 [Cryptomeria japonica]